MCTAIQKADNNVFVNATHYLISGVTTPLVLHHKVYHPVPHARPVAKRHESQMTAKVVLYKNKSLPFGQNPDDTV